MTPTVTVVIAAYNCGAFIREAVESVLQQSLSSIELIVVDDGSIDDTQQVLASISDVRLTVLCQKNSGVGTARNAGLAAARAPYIFFLDADDVLLPDALARMVGTLERMPQCVACFAHHLKIAEDGSELSKRADLRWKLFPAADTLRQLIAKNFIFCGAICVRTDAARAVAGFNPELRLGEDWEFWCRLAVLSDFSAMPNDVVLLYRQRSSGANHRLRSSPLGSSFAAIDAIYSNPAIRERFIPAELKRRRRLAEIDAFWAGARNEYAQGRIRRFLAYLAIGVLRYPDSVLRPRLVYLFFRGLRQNVARRVTELPGAIAVPLNAEPGRPGELGSRSISNRDEVVYRAFPEREPERALFLISRAATPCGVEMFARGAVQSSKPNGLEATDFVLEGHFSEVASLWAALARVDALIVNLPMVAWKRTFLLPPLALFLARLRGVRSIITLHEWADLDWRRRFVLSLYIVFAKTILFSSPYVRAQFTRGVWGWVPFSTGLVPIPANIAPPSRRIRTPICERLAAEKARGRLILGHFGSIYPQKQSTFVLDVAAELKRMGREIFVVFIGGFIRDSGNFEPKFYARAATLGLSDDLLVTGYIDTDAEIYSIFDLVDVFAYSFTEGLTSRRGSILACLQAGRPILVNRSADANEFEHHQSFKAAIGRSALHLLPTSADAKAFANAIHTLDLSRKAEPIAVFEQGWRDAIAAIKRAMSYRPGARNVGASDESRRHSQKSALGR